MRHMTTVSQRVRERLCQRHSITSWGQHSPATFSRLRPNASCSSRGLTGAFEWESSPQCFQSSCDASAQVDVKRTENSSWGGRSGMDRALANITKLDLDRRGASSPSWSDPGEAPWLGSTSCSLGQAGYSLNRRKAFSERPFWILLVSFLIAKWFRSESSKKVACPACKVYVSTAAPVLWPYSPQERGGVCFFVYSFTLWYKFLLRGEWLPKNVLSLRAVEYQIFFCTIWQVAVFHDLATTGDMLLLLGVED